MKFLIRVLGTTGNLIDEIIHMQRFKVKSLKDLYERCNDIRNDLRLEEKFDITKFEIIQYNKKKEFINSITLDKFDKYLIKHDNFPENIKEI